MASKHPRKLDDIVLEMCGVLGLDEAYEQHRIMNVWNTVVGDTITRVSRVRHCKDGVLYVTVFNASWRQELRFRKRHVLSALNKELGSDIVRDIVFY